MSEQGDDETHWRRSITAGSDDKTLEEVDDSME